MIAAALGTAAYSAAEPLTRDDARRAARHELTDRRYHADDPSPVERALQWLSEHIDSIVQRASHATGGNGWWLLGILAAIVALVVVIRIKVGPLARRAQRASPLDSAPGANAADHRARAAAHRRAGRYADAVRESMRAIATDLEDRTIVAVRPGRTAHELAREAAGALPGAAAGLLDAADLFDAVWFGGRPATDEHARTLAELDETIRRSRPVHEEPDLVGAPS